MGKINSIHIGIIVIFSLLWTYSIGSNAFAEDPETPEYLLISPVSSSRVDIFWNRPSDNITHYEIYRDGEYVTDSTETHYSHTGLSPDSTYYYSVSVCDGADCSSPVFEEYSATTLSGNEPLPVIPGTSGFGITTPAGRYGQIYKVTSLLESGPGSLREALQAQGPRVVIFEVSGTIDLTQDIGIDAPYITIAGQTAPFPGITIKGAGIRIFTHDVLIQHLRIRVGDDPQGPDPENRDGIGIEGDWGKNIGAYNVVIDHCSVSWAVDGNIDLWFDGAHDITIKNCIISEALNNSVHPKGPHSTGLLIGDTIKNVSVTGNLFAHNRFRNPLMKQRTSTVCANNVVYNAYYSMEFSARGGHTIASVVGNAFIPGPDSPLNMHFEVYGESPETSLFVLDNHCEIESNDPWACIENDIGDGIKATLTPIWPTWLELKTKDEMLELNLDDIGARPYDRDSVDIRVVDSVINGSGRIIDSQDDVGGWPVLAENAHTLTVPDDPHGDDDGDGYTNLEEWLHSFASEPSEPQDILYGDVSDDGAIDTTDTNLTVQFVVGLIDLTPEEIERADVSGNGSVSAFDASLIARYADSIIDIFPIE